MDIIVGLGDLVVTNDSSDVIKTFALASCLGVTAYSAVLKTAGMVHVVLPEMLENSSVSQKPAYYAAAGIPLLIDMMCKAGCLKNELKISIYGGADSKNNYFDIGRRNLEAAEKALELIGVGYELTDVGGYISRTLIMDVATGDIRVNTLPIIF